MFSVIIPAYNASKYVKEAIKSVLTQSMNDFEIIVIDDGSQDDTFDVVNSIADNRVRCIQQVNSGVAAARNKGIKNAKGEYICFLDADDLWKTNHLEIVMNLIEKYPMSSVYITGHEICLHNGTKIVKACPIQFDNMQSENMFKLLWEFGYFIHTNSIVCKKNVFDEIGYFELGVKNGEDDDMWYRLFSHYNVAISTEITTIYMRENSRATEKKIFVKDWIFLKRVEEIMNSSNVSNEKKEYLSRLLEQRKLSYVRYCIVNKEKKAAWKEFKQLNIKLLKLKKYIETFLALVFPYKIAAFVQAYRDKYYFKK